MIRPAVMIEIVSRRRTAHWDGAIITLSRVPCVGETVPTPRSGSKVVVQVDHLDYTGNSPDARVLLED